MHSLALPIAIIVCSNVFYNIIAKVTPEGVNPFAVLTATYVIAAVCSVSILVFQTGGLSLSTFKGVNWTAAAWSICLIGLEFGYIMAYRAGWNISVCSLVANILLAVILLGVGIFIWRESINLKQVFGIGFCLMGLILINKP